MASFDAIVVGSGPAGVFAAMGLRGRRVLMLDVGATAGPRSLPPENIFDLRRRGADLFADLIGENFESLHNIDRRYLSPKMKSPLMRFISDAPDAAPAILGERFEAVVSYARGGLANAWGAGVFRFGGRELEGFPVSAGELAPLYDEIGGVIGVSGANDDLEPDFGRDGNLQPPVPLSAISKTMYERYERARGWFARRGIRVGRSRAAILTRPLADRPAHSILNQEFFQPNLRSVYHPGYTLEQMVARGEVEYLQGRFVTRYEEVSTGVRVQAVDLKSGERQVIEARKLLIGAGALNSARLVLASNDDFVTRLPVLDNPVSYLPLLCLSRIGARLDTHGFSGAELIAVYEGELSPVPIQATFYGMVAPLRADLFFEFPLAIRGNLAATKYLTPAIGMLQVFYPDEPRADSYLQLTEEGALRVRYHENEGSPLIGRLSFAFARIGFLGHPRLSKHLTGGSSMHYAGSLPMRASDPGPYETDRYGLLRGTRHVHIVDAANFPRLPSKNLTFTIMANALRIGRHVGRELETCASSSPE